MADESTYGFSKSDASELVQLIGGGDVEFPEQRPRGSGSARMFRFKLTSGFDANDGTSASATIKEMGGVDLGADTVWDPEKIFSSLTADSTGLAVFTENKYWVIQAGCPLVEV